MGWRRHRKKIGARYLHKQNLEHTTPDWQAPNMPIPAFFQKTTRLFILTFAARIFTSDLPALELRAFAPSRFVTNEKKRLFRSLFLVDVYGIRRIRIIRDVLYVRRIYTLYVYPSYVGGGGLSATKSQQTKGLHDDQGYNLRGTA